MTQITETGTPTSRILNGRRIAANSEQHVRARRPDADIARKVVQRVRVRRRRSDTGNRGASRRCSACMKKVR